MRKKVVVRGIGIFVFDQDEENGPVSIETGDGERVDLPWEDYQRTLKESGSYKIVPANEGDKSRVYESWERELSLMQF